MQFSLCAENDRMGKNELVPHQSLVVQVNSRDSFSNVRDESRTITVRILNGRERFLSKDLKTQFIKLKILSILVKFTIEFETHAMHISYSRGLCWEHSGSVGKESTVTGDLEFDP